MKRCSMSLVREKQIKTTVRYHFTSTRMTIIQKTDSNKYWWRCGGTGTLTHCYWDCKMMEPFGKQFISSSKRLDTELPHDTAIPLPEKRKHTSPQTLVHEAFIVALFITAKEWKPLTSPPTDYWINKAHGACMHLCCFFRWDRLFANPRTAARQATLYLEFSRQEYWSGLPCPPPGDLPDPGIKLTSPASAGRFFHYRHLVSPKMYYIYTRFLVTKRNEVLIHDTTWMTLENIILSERSQPQKTVYWVNPLLWNCPQQANCTDKSDWCFSRAEGGVCREWGMIVSGYVVSSGVMKMF